MGTSPSYDSLMVGSLTRGVVRAVHQVVGGIQCTRDVSATATSFRWDRDYESLIFMSSSHIATSHDRPFDPASLVLPSPLSFYLVF